MLEMVLGFDNQIMYQILMLLYFFFCEENAIVLFDRLRYLRLNNTIELTTLFRHKQCCQVIHGNIE
jgi:hypothetical protein